MVEPIADCRLTGAIRIYTVFLLVAEIGD